MDDPYEETVKVINYMSYPIADYTRYCIPFSVNNLISLDTPIPRPSSRTGQVAAFLLPSYKHVSSNTYIVPGMQFGKLMTSILIHFQMIKPDLQQLPILCRIVNPYNDGKKVLLKIVDTATYRFMYTGLKEILFQDRVYKSSWGDCKGKDIAAKPLLACPIWTGKRWQYLMASEYISGTTVCSMRSYLPIFRRYDKKVLISSLEKAVQTLWMLGFSHNDLTDKNVLFDKKTNRAWLIDFESCTSLPDDIIGNFRHAAIHSKSHNLPIEALYVAHYKYPALSILSISEITCCRFVEEDRIITNTDDFFLEHARQIL